MMPLNKYIRAFTVLELIVVMIVSSIVILSLFTVMGNTQQLFRMSIAQSYKEVELLEFYQFLNDDIHSASAIQMQGADLLIQRGEDELRYEFFDGMVVRRHSVAIDTFYVRVQDFAIERHTDLHQYVGKISFRLSDVFEDIPLVIAKPYYRGQLFNMKIK